MRQVVFLLLLVLSTSAAATLTAQLDRDQVSMGQSVNLIITSDQSVSGKPDLSPLANDFSVLAQQQSSQFNLVNGKTSRQIQWVVSLMPKKAGKLTIPALTIGQQQTKPLSLTVAKAATAPGKQTDQQGVFLDASLSSREVYVDQPVIYTLKLYAAETVSGGNIMPPQLQQGEVRALNNDAQYRTTIDGKQYEVYQREFVITPTKPGKLSITPAEFNGMVFANGNGASLGMGLFQTNGNITQLSAPTLSLTVSPKPASVVGQWWLPATQVSLASQWQPAKPTFQVGQPITRTITLTAVGALDYQLPDIALNSTNDVNIYPEKPQSNLQLNDGKLVTTKTVSAAYIPTQAGEIALPAIAVKWWDVASKQLKTATLPAQTIHVEPAAAGSGNQVTPTQADQHEAAQTTASASTQQSNSLFRWLTFIFAGLWLLTLLAWLLRSRSPVNATPIATVISKKPLKLDQKAFKQACLANDAECVATMLLAATDNCLSLIELAGQVQSQPYAAQILTLDQARSTDQAWQAGEQLWQAFLAEQQLPKANQESPGPIPPLNPQ